MTAARRAGTGTPDAGLTRPTCGPHYYTPAELADLLRCSTGTLRNWRYRGEGPPYIKVGRVLYPVADLETWLATQQ